MDANDQAAQRFEVRVTYSHFSWTCTRPSLRA
jgi:hypothetical protein